MRERALASDASEKSARKNKELIEPLDALFIVDLVFLMIAVSRRSRGYNVDIVRSGKAELCKGGKVSSLIS